MLNDTFRFWAVNNSGETLAAGDISIKIQFWKIGTTGALEPDSGATTLTNDAAITDTNANDVCEIGAGGETDYDNSSNLWLGFHGLVSVTTGEGGGGAGVDIYIQFSPDGGTTWADSSDDSGVLLCHIDTPGSSTYDGEIAF